jgi:hypothetical protein
VPKCERGENRRKKQEKGRGKRDLGAGAAGVALKWGEIVVRWVNYDP